MKGKEEIKSKMMNLMERCLKERKRKLLSRSPSNCEFDSKVRIHGNGTIDVCQLTEKKTSVGSGIFVCDDSICEKCEFYHCNNTEESVTNEFNEILKNPSICGQEYPKLATLLWVLEGDIKKPSISDKILSLIKRILHVK